METTDLRTQSEKARDEKYTAICDSYRELASEHPACKPHRLMAIVAGQYGMSVPGIRNVLETRGVYARKRRIATTGKEAGVA